MTRGLKRLGAVAAKPRRGKQSKAPAALTLPTALTEEERQNARDAFDALTEASSALMDSGELDVYSKDKVMSQGRCPYHTRVSPSLSMITQFKHDIDNGDDNDGCEELSRCESRVCWAPCFHLPTHAGAQRKARNM